MDTNNSDKTDHIDQIIGQWQQERPDLDTSALQITARVVLLAKLLEQSYANDLVQHTESEILLALRRSGDPFQLTPSQLLNAVNLTSGAMTAALNRLQNKGWITRRPDLNDGRISLAVLTSSGFKFSDQIIEEQLEQASKQISILDEFEKRQLKLLLKKLLNKFE